MKRFLTEKLIAWKSSASRKPLVVKGVRQAGKTYSLIEFGRNNFSRIHSLNFEKDPKLAQIFLFDIDPKKIIERICFYLKTEININQDFLFFDEVQACPRALTSLKYFCEDMPQLALCAAGSLLGIHLNSDSFPVGKVNILDVYPMSFTEFLMAIDDYRSVEFLNQLRQDIKILEFIHDHIWQQLKIYFVTGGLPEVVKIFCEAKENLYSACKKVREKQDELIIAYAADMAKHSGKVNAMHLDRVWHAVPMQLSREQNGDAPKFQFRGIIPGITRYSRLVNVIDWLLAAGLIIKVPIVNSAALPLAAYSKENTFKLFMSDVGLLGAISNLAPETILQYEYGTYKGYFAENFVAQEFVGLGAKNIYCWQEKNSEVDFLREIEGNIIPIEVKSGVVKHAKSLKGYIDKYKPSYSVILSSKDFYVDKITKIHYYPLYLANRVGTL